MATIVAFEPADTWQETGPGRYTVTTASGALRARVELPRCPNCGTQIVARLNKATGLRFGGCSAFPRCKYSATIQVRRDSACPIGPGDHQAMENGLASWERATERDDALDQKFGHGRALNFQRDLQDAGFPDPFGVDPQGAPEDDIF